MEIDEEEFGNTQDFIEAIYQMINYWDGQKDRSSKEKMEGLAHSILCMLDGVSGSFGGNIHTLIDEGDDFMFHEMFYKNVRLPTDK